MKLKIFSTKTFPKAWGGAHSTTPKVNFSKSGCIAFNKAAAQLIGLGEKAKITIAQDEEAKENWYAFIDENGFEVRPKNKKAGSTEVGFNHKALYLEACKELGKKNTESFNFLVAGLPTTIKGDKTKYWGLIAVSKL